MIGEKMIYVQFSMKSLTFDLFKHVHVHVLPRKKGDFENNDDIYDKLASHDRDNNTPLRSLEERSKEAAELRKYF